MGPLLNHPDTGVFCLCLCSHFTALSALQDVTPLQFGCSPCTQRSPSTTLTKPKLVRRLQCLIILDLLRSGYSPCTQRSPSTTLFSKPKLVRRLQCLILVDHLRSGDSPRRPPSTSPPCPRGVNAAPSSSLCGRNVISPGHMQIAEYHWKGLPRWQHRGFPVIG